MFFFLLFFFGVGKDAFVLCRVFHKSNIGPPSGQRYTPFIEEDWDDGKLAVVPGMGTVDEPVAGRGQDACIEGNNSHLRCIDGNSHDPNVEGNAHDPNVKGNNTDQVCSLYTLSPFLLNFLH